MSKVTMLSIDSASKYLKRVHGKTLAPKTLKNYMPLGLFPPADERAPLRRKGSFVLYWRSSTLDDYATGKWKPAPKPAPLIEIVPEDRVEQDDRARDLVQSRLDSYVREQIAKDSKQLVQTALAFDHVVDATPPLLGFRFTCHRCGKQETSGVSHKPINWSIVYLSSNSYDGLFHCSDCSLLVENFIKPWQGAV